MAAETIQIAGKEYTREELYVLAKAGVLNVGQKNDPASTTLTPQSLHGPFQDNAAQLGLFAGVGIRPDRFSAMPRIDSMIQAIVSMGGLSASQFTNERLDIVTGQTAGGSTNAASFCGNPPVVGNLKIMRRDFTWGSYYVKTNLNAIALLGQFNTRADVPGQIINMGAAGNPLIPDVMFQLPTSQSQLRLELFKIGVDLERTLEVVAQRGTAGSDNSRTGWFAEFAGLESQVTTGITDAATGLAAAAADSTVVAYNADITGTNADGSGRNFYETLRDTVVGREIDARRVGMSGTTFAIVGRAELLHRLVEVVALQTSIFSGIGAGAGDPVTRDGEAIERRRLEMLNGGYVILDGRQYPLIPSEGQDLEGIANNTYRNDLFVVPMSWAGRPLTRMEYFPMNNASSAEFAQAFGSTDISTLNNGMFLVGKRDTGLCVEYHFQMRMRLILEVPFLAARIDNIEYSYFLNTRTSRPGESLYVDGGTSYRS
jgi:hypothetical protein